MLALVVLALVAAGDEPSAVPSGMDLLYGDRIAFTPSGEPIVTIGLMSGQRQITARAQGELWVDYYEAGVQKRTLVQANQNLGFAIRRAKPAERRYYVDVDGVRFGDGAALERALQGWRARGYKQVEALEEGVVLGVAGRVLDNREYRLVLPTAKQSDATRLVDEIFERFGVRGVVHSRLRERPWAELTLTVDGKPLGSAVSYVRLAAKTGLVEVLQVEFARGYAWHGYEDRRFRGEIYVVVDPEGLLAAVNVLGVEGVLAGVVPAEIFASAPPEALKAQAVAARNHLLAKLGKSHHDDPFELCSEQHCQVYAGLAKEDVRTSAAVSATSGEALFHSGQLVEAVYSSSCGGHTEDNDAVWGIAPSPALRARPDFDVGAHPELTRFGGVIAAADMPAWVSAPPASFCAKATSVRPDKLRWSRTLTRAQLESALTAARYNVGQLQDLVVDDRGPGGRVMTLRVVGDKGTARVVYELPIRKLFGNLNSGMFVLEATRESNGALTSITFRGGGWGHGVGMCQLGAIGRAEAGHVYRQILGHYFNGATLTRLYEP